MTAVGSPDALAVVVVGAGPRGLSVLERICANAAGTGRPVAVHLVDPYPPGPGAVWRTGRPGELLMNTVASQVTVFTDDSVDCVGPAVPGPSLYEWARTLDGAGAGSCPQQVLAEARQLSPDTYPTRAFHGHYLEWVFGELLRTAPEEVAMHTRRSTAVALDDTPDGCQRVTTEDGGLLAGMDAVVLDLGHGGPVPDQEECAPAGFARRHGLGYVGAGNPADADLDGIPPGRPVALRGLGLTFFDHLALLTEGRGGAFKESETGLVYLPNGNEPVMYAGSRRGVPYHARGDNEKGALGRHHPRFLTAEVIAGLRRRADGGRPVGFREGLWPLIDREVRTVTGRCPEPDLLDHWAVPLDERWDWRRIERPYGERRFASRDDFRQWVQEHLRQDVVEARRSNVNGPLKTALDALRDLRNEIRLVVDHGGISGASYRAELDGWYTPLNAFTSIRPPAFRIQQLIALAEAGVLHLVGPGMQVRPSERDGGYLVDAELVSEPPVLVDALIEARLPGTDLRRSANPLLRALYRAGACVPYRWDGHEPGGLAVTEDSSRLLDAAGRAHPHRFAFGVPAEGARWLTAVGVRPGVGSVTLEDSDAIARAVLGLAEPERPSPCTSSRAHQVSGTGSR